MNKELDILPENVDANALTQNIDQLIDWVKQSAETVGNFANDQVPLYVQELLNWVFWSNTILVSSVLLTILLLGVVFRKFWAYLFSEESIDDTDGAILILHGIFAAVMVGVLVCGVYQPFQEAVKVSVAPRVVLVEKLAETIKVNK